MKYWLFSRKNGYANSEQIAKYFYTSIINDENDITKEFIDKSGKEIINELNEKKYDNDNNVIQELKELSETYYDWYYYPRDTKITESKIIFY